MTFLEVVEQHPIAILASGILVGAPIIQTLIGLLKDLVTQTVRLVTSALWVTKSMNDDFTAGIIAMYLKSKGRTFDLGHETFDAEHHDRLIFYKKFVHSRSLFLFRGVPLVINPANKGAPGKPGEAPTSTQASVQFFRWTVDFTKLVQDACEYYERYQFTQKTRQFRVVRLGGYIDKDEMKQTHENLPSKSQRYRDFSKVPVNITVDELISDERESSIDKLALTAPLKALLKDVKFWLSHRKWYETRGLTWRRGYLLFGKPGTGKTSIIRAIAEDLDIPIFIFDLASMSNGSFQTAWDYAKNWDKRIILFEDFDTVFKGRINLMAGGLSRLTYETILNAVDGIERTHGMILFVTTNHVEDIDEAMGRPRGDDNEGSSTRPGRIDVAIEVPSLDREGRVKVAFRILDPNDPELDRVVDEASNDTPAQFTDRCCKKALKDLWARRPDDDDMAA